MGGKMVCFHLLSASLMFDHFILALFSFAKTNLPQLHFTINLMYSQIIDGLLPQNSKNHIFPWPYFYVSFVALEHHLEWTFGIPRVLQAIFRNSILNGKAIEDQYVSSRHKRRPPQIPQSLTLAPIMKKKVGLNSWIWGCEEWVLPWISVLEKVVGALTKTRKIGIVWSFRNCALWQWNVCHLDLHQFTAFMDSWCCLPLHSDARTTVLRDERPFHCGSMVPTWRSSATPSCQQQVFRGICLGVPQGCCA